MTNCQIIRFFLAAVVFSANSFSTSTLAAETTQKQGFLFKGDSLSWDTPNNQMMYSGNASFRAENLQISGDQIIARRTQKGLEERVEVTGSPAKFSEHNSTTGTQTLLDSLYIEYRFNDNLIVAKGQVQLNQTQQDGSLIKINGDNLTLNTQQSQSIVVSGSPMKLYFNENSQSAFSAQADELLFDQQSNKIHLSGNVLLKSERETMSAEQVIYQIDSKVLTVPKSNKGQVEIIQTNAAL